MNERTLRISLLLVPLALVACFGGEGNDPDSEGGASSSSAVSSLQSVSSLRETRNVTYQGVIEDAGISIYMEGTHRLALDDGRFLLLESDSLELSSYANQQVEVTGSLRPTVEAGGIIMQVERVVTVGTASSLQSESSRSDSSASSAVAVVSSVASVPVTVSVSSVAPVSSAAVSSIATPSSATVTSAPSAQSSIANDSTVSAEMEARITTMASHDLASTNWSQEYCTEHIGFCFPVHRNWWYHSFGVTTSLLWHVEVGPEEITNLGDGPIQVNLVSGALAGATDGQVRVQGGTVTGYRQWSEDRHFQIIADARLEAAVRYITSNLFAMPDEE